MIETSHEFRPHRCGCVTLHFTKPTPASIRFDGCLISAARDCDRVHSAPDSFAAEDLTIFRPLFQAAWQLECFSALLRQIQTGTKGASDA